MLTQYPTDSMNLDPSRRHPPAAVLSCIGGEETALNVTRALGRHGVPVIVVSESAQRPAAAISRYCIEHVVAAPYSSQPEGLARALHAISQRHGAGIPVFPTADPDLDALNRIAAVLQSSRFVSTLGDAALISRLMDKSSFADLAREHALSVPPSWRPADRTDVHSLIDAGVPWPLIVKPAFPFNWSPGLVAVFRGRKALAVHSAAELLTLLDRIEEGTPGLPEGATLGILVQQLIDAPDDQHYDVHAYIDRQGCPRATFVGRKWRIYPAHAGSGAFIESVSEPALQQSTTEMLCRIGFRGIANVNYKRDAKTGRFWLLEINARVSQWSGFPARLGVDVAWLAYCDACGLPMPTAKTPEPGIFFVDLYNDLRAARSYVREGEWTWPRYTASLFKVRHSQVFDPFDLKPWWALTQRKLERT